MHTSSRLTAQDFQHWKSSEQGRVKADFSDFCPDYHELDRLAVVCPRIEDGVLHTGYALLSTTTAFYDVLRGRGGEFFNYPSHFAFIAAGAEGVCTRGGQQPMEANAMGAPWSNLDVWPDTQWITVPGTASAMLEKVFSFHINRLFWPEGFGPEAGEIKLSKNARRLLEARLKTVYYYSPASPNVEIHAAQCVEDLVLGSISQLPDPARLERVPPAGDELPYVEKHRRVGVDKFLEFMDSSFDQ